MNGSAEPLEEDVQTEDVLDETFVISDMQTVPGSIAEIISTASDSPKHTEEMQKTSLVHKLQVNYEVLMQDLTKN